MYLRQSKHVEAKDLCEKALLISKEVNDKKAEASCYGHLGTVYQLVGEYKEAIKHLEKALAISKEIGDKNEEPFVTETLE